MAVTHHHQVGSDQETAAATHRPSRTSAPRRALAVAAHRLRPHVPVGLLRQAARPRLLDRPRRRRDRRPLRRRRLDQRRQPHRGLPQVRRRRSVQGLLQHASPAPPGPTCCSCSACSASALALTLGVAHAARRRLRRGALPDDVDRRPAPRQQPGPRRPHPRSAHPGRPRPARRRRRPGASGAGWRRPSWCSATPYSAEPPRRTTQPAHHPAVAREIARAEESRQGSQGPHPRLTGYTPSVHARTGTDQTTSHDAADLSRSRRRRRRWRRPLARPPANRPLPPDPPGPGPGPRTRPIP